MIEYIEFTHKDNVPRHIKEYVCHVAGMPWEMIELDDVNSFMEGLVEQDEQQSVG